MRNDGIGRTDLTTWSDTVTIARNSDGTERHHQRPRFEHIGVLEAGGSYIRTGSVLLPNVLSGPVYVIVRSARPVRVHLRRRRQQRGRRPGAGHPGRRAGPRRDRYRRPRGAPYEGDTIDITWTVRNDGTARRAGRAWVDTIFLRKPGLDPNDPATPRPIVLGSFTYLAGARRRARVHAHRALHAAGHIEGGWQIAVTTDVGNAVFEGATELANNTTYDDAVLLRVAEAAARPAGRVRSPRPST